MISVSDLRDLRLAWFVAGPILTALALAVGSCSSGSGGSQQQSGTAVNDCSEPGAACPSENGYARFCALVDAGTALQCLNVCENPADFAPGSVPEGGLCELDQDCATGTTCDNDVVGGSATCRCVATPTCETDLDVAFWSPTLLGACTAAQWVQDFGSADGTGEWSLKRTCRGVDGTCAQTGGNIGIGRDAEDTTSLCWADVLGDHAPGQLCASDFSFAGPVITGEYSTGLFHFSTSVDFEADWIIYDRPGGEIVARCKGKGRASSAGSPDDPPNCDDYFPFAPPVTTPIYDGVFNERYSCVQEGVCVDQDAASRIVITLATPADSFDYRIGSDDGYYNGHGIRVGTEISWVASSHDPANPDQDYTETGTFNYADSDHFTVTSRYTFTRTGVVGNCTGRAARGNATPSPPDPLPPCP